MNQPPHPFDYFICHPELTEIARQNNQTRLNEFINRYPGSETIIRQAYLLIQHIKIEAKPVPALQMEEDYNLFMEQIRRKQKRDRTLWLSAGSVAATLCLLFALSLFTDLFRPATPATTSHILSLLDAMDTQSEEVKIISGGVEARVADNQSITQTEAGDLLVGKEEKVRSEQIETEYIQLIVPNGRRTHIRFHDGTVAWVNSGSKLIYPKTFAADKREIFIEGEIYLEVEKAGTQPFIVHTKVFDIEVLGTSFNVNAYSEDEEQSVVLIEGSVSIAIENITQKLTPSQGLFASEGRAVVRKVDTTIYTCWKEGIMRVEGETLTSLFARLARHYNVPIEIENKTLAGERYRGKVNLEDSLEEILDNLSASIPFRYQKNEDGSMHIYIK